MFNFGKKKEPNVSNIQSDNMAEPPKPELEVLPDDESVIDESKKIIGKIIYLRRTAGWGFIASHDIPFTRIFFHWTGLEQDTYHFTELEKGMKVEFNPKEFKDLGLRAIKIRVIEVENKGHD